MTVRPAAVMVMPRASPYSAIVMAIVGAWLVIVIAQASGIAPGFHHHALIGRGAPGAVAIAGFLVAWLVMIVAMMWPASLHAVHACSRGLLDQPRPRLAVAGFLGASAIVWAGFGLAAFVGDIAVHHVVDTSPWLGARPWLIEAGVLAMAGGYQFMPLKRRYLAACRRPDDRVMMSSAPAGRNAVRSGLVHGFDCLGSSWAVMLVMFGSGFASFWSMAALTMLMVYEATGRHGERAATIAGVALLLGALTVLSGPVPAAAASP